MKKSWILAPFGLGAAALMWVAFSYSSNHPIALVMTLGIAAVYGVGALEMRRFWQGTQTLRQALPKLPREAAQLTDWLTALPEPLREPVRRRIGGEPIPLPGPALTPYFVGLLVMLGMLGTFLGLVVTLSGTATALESSTDLSLMRTALASPIKGLGLAFGTSLAGVAGSAMLGLISALCRHDRLLVVRELDARIDGPLRDNALQAQRRAAYRAVQTQSEALPQLVSRIEEAMGTLVAQNQVLQDRMLAQQTAFFADTRLAFTGLAQSVDQSLQRSLADASRLAGEAIQPAVQSSMSALSRQAETLNGTLTRQLEGHLAAVSGQLNDAMHTLATRWEAGVHQQETSAQRMIGFLQESQASAAAALDHTAQGLVAQLRETHIALRQDLAQQEAGRFELWRGAWNDTTQSLQTAWAETQADARAHQDLVAQSLRATADSLRQQTEEQTRAVLSEVGQLMQLASEAPREAARVIARLHEEVAAGRARDQSLLEERERTLTALTGLINRLQESTAAQHTAVDQLLDSAGQWLNRVQGDLSTVVACTDERLDGAIQKVSASAGDITQLGAVLGEAIQRMADQNNQLVERLGRLESALGESLARSDEQLGYYVAQARELIDLTLLSQRRLLEEMQQRLPAPSEPEALA